MAGTFQGNCLCGVLGAGMFMAGCAFLLIAAFPVGQIALGSYHIYSIYPPNYNKNTTGSNSSTRKIYAITSPDSLTSENQSLQSFNHSQIFWGMIQTGALKNMSRRTNRDLKNTQQPHEVVAVLPYCNRTVYLFAFWTTTLVHVLVGNALLLIICLYGFMKCMDVFVRHLTT
ncbi:hypothetical protein CRENBAI_013549 [Crenichthys baileyi]|uniref:Uncharacterized protein n=1 Tax=Crenichthys baileyi TaxID=28760 RepID=A0AAV9RLY5_9TELE